MIEVGVKSLKTKLTDNLLQIWCGMSFFYKRFFSGLSELNGISNVAQQDKLEPTR